MQPDPSYLAECLRYDPLSGEVIWLSRPREHFATVAAYKTFLTTKAGKVAGCVDHSTGYIVIGLNAKLLYAHRAAWALAHGEWPDEQIDHIDGDKTNNRLSNLRCVTHAENARNMPLAGNNRSGANGVGFAKREGKWRARLMTDYHDVHLGYFGTKEEAIEARNLAEREHGFHENHGRKA